MGRDFRIVWFGQGVSSVGTAVTAVALPLLALLELHVAAWQVGLQTAVTYAAYALLALPSGVWLDRRLRRPVVVAGDAGRLVALASIPLARALGVLTFAQLVVVAAVVGALTVVFDVAYQSWLPSLVEAEALVTANGRLGATDAAGRLAGPGIAGVLVAAIGAGYAIGVDAISFAVAAAATLAVRAREPRRAPSNGQPRRLRAQMREGLAWLRAATVQRQMAVCSATANFFVAVWLAVETVFLVRTLHAPAPVVGGVFAVGSCGGVLGGGLAGRVNRRLGSGRAVFVAAALGGPFALIAPLGTALLGPWSVAAGVFGVSATSAVYNAGVLSYRQRSTPREMLARVTSAVRVITSTALPVGALVGGALATDVGPRTTMIVAAVGYGAAACWLLPLRNQRELPNPEPVHAIASR